MSLPSTMAPAVEMVMSPFTTVSEVPAGTPVLLASGKPAVEMGAHWPLALQLCPEPQVPHEPPHPSEPHSFPRQLGVQVAVHWPLALQLCPEPQVPHEPPHPSEPHCLPAQLGVHAPVFNVP